MKGQLTKESSHVALVFATQVQRAVHVSVLRAKGKSEDLATPHCPADVNRYEAAGRDRCQSWISCHPVIGHAVVCSTVLLEAPAAFIINFHEIWI